LVNDYRDWGVPLGRRFRALKLWFVLRSMGIEGIQEKLRYHIHLNRSFSESISNSPGFVLAMEPFLNFTCFRLQPEGLESTELLNKLNERFLEEINASGRIFLTHTKINDLYTIRMVIGQTYVEEKHVELALSEIQLAAEKVLTKM
jgi:aromatic-L-amino-acid decarboxylase